MVVHWPIGCMHRCWNKHTFKSACTGAGAKCAHGHNGGAGIGPMNARILIYYVSSACTGAGKKRAHGGNGGAGAIVPTTNEFDTKIDKGSSEMYFK